MAVRHRSGELNPAFSWAISTADADVVGFICPVYEWDIPGTMKDFAEKLTVSDKEYTFMVATYVGVHGRCFETMGAILRAC